MEEDYGGENQTNHLIDVDEGKKKNKKKKRKKKQLNS